MLAERPKQVVAVNHYKKKVEGLRAKLKNKTAGGTGADGDTNRTLSDTVCFGGTILVVWGYAEYVRYGP